MSNSKSVVFSTKCWENDYEAMAAYGFEIKAQMCNYPFDARWIMINNVSNEDYVYDLFADKADLISVVEESADEVLGFFNITKDSFGCGYYYSICELTEIYVAGFHGYQYLVHFASDVRMEHLGDWITSGIEILEKNEDVIVVSPKPIQDNLIENTVTTWFSDTCFLIRVKDWCKPNIFNYEYPEENQYPVYGGNSFERRAGRYLINSGKKRLWLKDFSTVHPVI